MASSLPPLYGSPRRSRSFNDAEDSLIYSAENSPVPLVVQEEELASLPDYQHLVPSGRQLPTTRENEHIWVDFDLSDEEDDIIPIIDRNVVVLPIQPRPPLARGTGSSPLARGPQSTEKQPWISPANARDLLFDAPEKSHEPISMKRVSSSPTVPSSQPIQNRNIPRQKRRQSLPESELASRIMAPSPPMPNAYVFRRQISLPGTMHGSGSPNWNGISSDEEELQQLTRPRPMRRSSRSSLFRGPSHGDSSARSTPSSDLLLTDGPNSIRNKIDGADDEEELGKKSDSEALSPLPETSPSRRQHHADKEEKSDQEDQESSSSSDKSLLMKRKHGEHILYLSTFAIFGESMRIFLTRLFGADCEDPLTTFASWNEQMIIMLDGTGTDLGSQIVPALFGYVLGLLASTASFLFGTQVSTWLNRWKNPDIAQQQDAEHQNTPMSAMEEGHLHENTSASPRQMKTSTANTGQGTPPPSGAIIGFPPFWQRTEWLRRGIGRTLGHHRFPFVLLACLLSLYAIGDGVMHIPFYRMMWLSSMLTPPGALIRWNLAKWNARASLSTARRRRLGWLPWGTLIANVVASMISAALAAIQTRYYSGPEFDDSWTRALLDASRIGFAGCLSTVSTMVHETFELADRYKHHAKCYYYPVLTILCSALLSLCVYSPVAR